MMTKWLLKIPFVIAQTALVAFAIACLIAMMALMCAPCLLLAMIGGS